MKARIYLDNSATTRVDDRVVEAMIPAMTGYYGNASSIHTFGQEARAAVEKSRRSIADLLGAEPREIVFTSGGTESDNAALWGVYRGRERTGHIVTTRIEHPAVLSTCRLLEQEGADVTYIPVGADGRADPAKIAESFTERTILISVMHANNETGVIQPIEEIAALAQKHGILLHTDAVQSAGKLPLNVRKLGIDLLSLSAHKMHGPKGVGALYIRNGVKPVPFMTGGSHERRRRAGTENVPGIVGFGVAARLALERLPEMKDRIGGLRDRLEKSMKARIPGVGTNGSETNRIPNIANLSFGGLEGEAAVIALDLAGVAVSTGSACSSGSLEPSHVLIAMGLKPEVVQSSLRFSLCYHNSEDEIDRTVEIVEEVVNRLRGLSGRSRL